MATEAVHARWDAPSRRAGAVLTVVLGLYYAGLGIENVLHPDGNESASGLVVLAVVPGLLCVLAGVLTYFGRTGWRWLAIVLFAFYVWVLAGLTLGLEHARLGAGTAVGWVYLVLDALAALLLLTPGSRR